jgi:hypothetical protein
LRFANVYGNTGILAKSYSLLSRRQHGKGGGMAKGAARGSRGRARFWMVLDALTILASAMLATLYRMHTGPMAGARGFWHGTLIHGRSMGILLVLLCGFAVTR